MKTGIIWFFIALIGALLWLHLPSVVLPFVIAFLLAYALNPVMDSIENLPRSVGALLLVAFTMAIFVSFMIVLIPLIYGQMSILVKKIPIYRAFVNETVMPFISVKLSAIDDNVATSVKDTMAQSIDDIFAIFMSMLNNIWSYTMATISAMIMLFLIPVLLFYFLRDWHEMQGSFYGFFPKKLQSFVQDMFSDINDVLASYIRGQLLVCLIWGIYYYIALSCIGVELAFILAIISGLSPIVPIVGAIISIFSTMLVGFFTFGFGTELLYILCIHGLGAILDSTYVTPKIIGKSIGLSPVWIMFSIFTMGYMLGPVGMLIGVPIAGIVSVILKYATRNYKESKLYNKSK